MVLQFESARFFFIIASVYIGVIALTQAALDIYYIIKGLLHKEDLTLKKKNLGIKEKHFGLNLQF